MSFNFINFANDHGLGLTDHGHKHCRPGWIQLDTDCLFCSGNPGLHLGYNINQDYFRCWRCGHHWANKVVKKFLNCSAGEANRLIKEYGGRPIRKNKRDGQAKKKIDVKLPPGTDTMRDRHYRYLKSRGFNPGQLEERWGLMGTGSTGQYKHRIIAPIFYQGSLVSYQGRDITNKSPLKYKACAAKNEAINHQALLYGYDEAQGGTVIVVEGVFDVWRFGPGAVSCFGIKYTAYQVKLLTSFDKIFVAFDPNEDEAEKQSDLLAEKLCNLGKAVEIIDLETSDPADMNQKEADEIMRELIWPS